ncbi:M10 family metallopeptidase C-terminal domain-containing protein [Parvularcula dongshanensis]|uniref:Ca2+-binding RTX toxin-like protein n=1 Tax=Parvularcula dongshanensis TaxID=1173995 RepID=A0A840I1N1_9PROT|nr:M10 family metallopeptidase C-terminal domain-containing protein [Parvularcula dongshanensis]MBB4658255.1 Ca2+-binding RTX toxin-like protein [Parvularcula dongshanensis]
MDHKHYEFGSAGFRAFGAAEFWRAETAPVRPARSAVFDVLPSFSHEEAAAQISRLDWKWDDGDAGTGRNVALPDGSVVFDPNALGTPGTVTYGYLDAAGMAAFGIEGDGTFALPTAAQIADFEDAIALIEQVANIDFRRVGGAGGASSPGTVEIGLSTWTNGGGGVTFFEGGDGEMISAAATVSSWSFENGEGFFVALHEILHAVGLSHPGEYDGEAAVSYDAEAEYREDSLQYTVMSYWGEDETGGSFRGAYPTGLMLHDVLALQRLYGARGGVRAGDDVYGVAATDPAFSITGESSPPIAAVWDTGGIDTFDFSTITWDQTIDLRPGAISSVGSLYSNLAIVPGVVIENARGGSGNDLLIGNDARNLLDGGEGFDTVSYEHEAAGVVAHLGAGAPGGSDLMIAIETMIGSPFADRLSSSVDAELQGGGGNDTLTGGGLLDGGAGHDLLIGASGGGLLIGGGGDDTLRGVANDGQFVFAGDDGFDIADLRYATRPIVLTIPMDEWGYVDYSLVTDEEGIDALREVEGLILSRYDDDVTGTWGADYLDGWEGNDTLIGGGGDDTLMGGPGDDVIFADDGAGAYAVILNGTPGADVLTGNARDNEIHGFGGDDRLSGGAGSDTLYAGAGNDTLLGDGDYDLLLGEAGDDTLTMTAFAGAANGGDGWDTLDLSRLSKGARVILDPFGGRGVPMGADFWDWEERFTTYSIEEVIGTSYADEFILNIQGAVIDAGAGNDVFDEFAFGSTLLGGLGDDRLFVGGDNVLTGGAGRDVFDARGRGGTVITDFEDGVDRIDLSYVQVYVEHDGVRNARWSDVSLTQEAEGVRVDVGDADFLLHGVGLEQITQADFIL